MKDDVTAVPGIGPKTAQRLARLNIYRPADLLFLFPRRYIDRSTLHTVRDFFDGSIPGGEGSASVPAPIPLEERSSRRALSVAGRIRRVSARPTSRRGLWAITAVLHDGTGDVELVWFRRGYGGKAPEQPVQQGNTYVATGAVKIDRGRRPTMNDPQVETIEGETAGHAPAAFPPIPVYPLTEGITQRQIKQWVQWALDHRGDDNDLGLSKEPFIAIHQPESMDDVESGRRTIAFAELLAFQRGERQRRARQPLHAPALNAAVLPRDVFDGQLPFALTKAQREAIATCQSLFSQRERASVLLQGDVGSGKTVIAAYVGALTVQSGKQAVMMAPTRLLSEQHAHTLQQLLRPFNVTPFLLTSETKPADRRGLAQRLKRGDPAFVVGTQAVLGDDLHFSRLAVAIVDEQHRFGVAQRHAFAAQMPYHTLTMSATPIPRSLALVLYAGETIVRLNERPPGRPGVETRWIHPDRREDVWAYIARRVGPKERAIVVYPRVHDDEEGRPGVITAYRTARRGPLKGAACGIIYGTMPPDEQETVMDRFARGDVQVLFATTVIEVGIDIPEATIIVVEEADRFGLAQLHQLRGRVGRGERAGMALLIADPKSATALQRINALRHHDDGFYIAELDLALRGPGDLFGTRQSGLPSFRAANLYRDVDLMEKAARVAAQDKLPDNIIGDAALSRLGPGNDRS